MKQWLLCMWPNFAMLVVFFSNVVTICLCNDGSMYLNDQLSVEITLKRNSILSWRLPSICGRE